MRDQENQLNHSNQFQATEDWIRQVGLPDAKGDRDLLMYRSGYNAAVAQLNQGSVVPPKRLPGSRKALIWPALTTVFGVTAAVCLVMLNLGTGQTGKTNNRVAKVSNRAQSSAIDPLPDAIVDSEIVDSGVVASTVELSVPKVFELPATAPENLETKKRNAGNNTREHSGWPSAQRKVWLSLFGVPQLQSYQQRFAMVARETERGALQIVSHRSIDRDWKDEGQLTRRTLGQKPTLSWFRL